VAEAKLSKSPQSPPHTESYESNNTDTDLAGCLGSPA